MSYKHSIAYFIKIYVTAFDVGLELEYIFNLTWKMKQTNEKEEEEEDARWKKMEKNKKNEYMLVCFFCLNKKKL